MKIFAMVIAACLMPPVHGYAASTLNLPKQLQGVGIDQHLNAAVPLDVSFTDQDGNPVQLRKYFGSKPVLFAPVYFTCPMLCDQILGGLVAGLRPLSLKPGRDFEIVAMSFNPADTTADAKRKRDQFSHSYSSRAGTDGWNFLTGSQSSIDRVTKAIGFRYHWDAAHNMFVHASGIMIMTPEGRLARYFYGVEFEPKDLKLGLVEASHNRIGSAVDQILLFCYHYDPTTGKYGAVVINLLRIVAAVVLIALTLMLVFFWRRDIRAARSSLEGGRHV
jgi:protein SCO1